MEQKRVTFKVAKYLKEVGYPQEGKFGYRDGESSLVSYPIDGVEFYVAPTYIDVWFWWCDHLNYINKRKLQSIRIFKGKNKWEVRFNCGCLLDSDDDDGCYYEFIGNTQEEAISNAIDYLADNNLIK